MPVAKGKGGKKRRRGKNIVAEDTGLLKSEPGQAYGRILKLLGNGRANVECYIWEKNKKTDKMEMQLRKCVAKIRGKLMKRMWMATDDIILVGLRDFQEDRVDIIHRYSYNDALKLKKLELGIPNVKLDKYAEDTGEELDFHEDEDISNTTNKKHKKRTEFISYNNLGQMDMVNDSDVSDSEKTVNELGNFI